MWWSIAIIVWLETCLEARNFWNFASGVGWLRCYFPFDMDILKKAVCSTSDARRSSKRRTGERISKLKGGMAGIGTRREGTFKVQCREELLIDESSFWGGAKLKGKGKMEEENNDRSCSRGSEEGGAALGKVVKVAVNSRHAETGMKVPQGTFTLTSKAPCEVCPSEKHTGSECIR